MSTVVHIPHGRLGAVLRATGKAVQKRARDALRLAAHHGQATLVARTDEEGLIDQGLYKNAWGIHEGPNGEVELRNDAPYAGVIERGARPHAMSDVAILQLEAWVRRRLKPVVKSIARQRKKYGPKSNVRVSMRDREEAVVHGIAMAIAMKLRQQGQPGRWPVRETLPKLVEYAREEVSAAIRDLIQNPPGIP